MPKDTKSRLLQISKAAGVSPATVSRVMNHPELVKKAAEEFQRNTGPDGYQPLLPKDAKPWMKK